MIRDDLLALKGLQDCNRKKEAEFPRSMPRTDRDKLTARALSLSRGPRARGYMTFIVTRWIVLTVTITVIQPDRHRTSVRGK
jgi:hypothetical protein